MTKEIHYLNGFTDTVVLPLPTSVIEDFKVTGDKEVAAENFQQIMKSLPAWIERRQKWIEKYESIRDSLDANPNKDYLLGLILRADSPNDWLNNRASEDSTIGVIYSFEIVHSMGEGFFCTGPYLFVSGYAYGCEPKKIFEIQIKLELVK